MTTKWCIGRSAPKISRITKGVIATTIAIECKEDQSLKIVLTLVQMSKQTNKYISLCTGNTHFPFDT